MLNASHCPNAYYYTYNVAGESVRISGQLAGMSWLTSQLMGLTVDEAIYRSSWGQPSVVMLLPYSNALASSTVSSSMRVGTGAPPCSLGTGVPQCCLGTTMLPRYHNVA
jgi:hypothetical protein